MKILLINFASRNYVHTKFRLINRKWPPLDLLQAATLLKKEGFAVELLDLRVNSQSVNQIREKLNEYDWVFVSSTPLDKWQCPDPDPSDFIDFLIKLNSNSRAQKICAAGVHSTVNREKILERAGILYTISGQTEFGIIDFIKSQTGQKQSNRFYNFDELSPPAYELVNLNSYYYELLGNRLALIETQRGCPYQCSFCFKLMYGNRVLKKSLRTVKAEIDYTADLGAKSVYFIDLEFTLNKERIYEICEHILSKGYRIKWCCQTRVDAVDRGLLRKMAHAGCSLIHYGIESGSERILREIKKGIGIQQIREAVNETKRAGIKVAGFFILGFPGETHEEMKQTISFAKSLPLDYASFHPYIPYNQIFNQLSITEQNPSNLSKDEMKTLLRTAYIQFYCRPKYIVSKLGAPDALAKKFVLFLNMLK